MSNPITTAIEAAIKSTAPKTKERNKALAKVRWVLQSADGYAGLAGMDCVLVEEIAQAQVFDGRDNENLKAMFYGRSLATHFVPTLLPA